MSASSNYSIDVIDLNQEFILLVDLINQLWDGCDADTVRTCIRVAFEHGLADGKLWIDEHFTFRIAKILNGDNEVRLPLDTRKHMLFDVDCASLYDALCRFDDRLNYGVKDIHHSVSNSPRWSFTKQVDALFKQLNDNYGPCLVKPKNQSKKVQTDIVKEYKGNHALDVRSFSTPERLLRSNVVHYRNEGIPFDRNLIATVYAHALYCVKEKNSQTLVNDVLPIYSRRNEPLNIDNGGEILSAAMKNQFVSIIHGIQPFEFSSTEIYLRDQEASIRARKERPIKSTEEEDADLMKDLLEDLKGIDLEIEQDKIKINAYIDSILPSIEAFKLSV